MVKNVTVSDGNVRWYLTTYNRLVIKLTIHFYVICITYQKLLKTLQASYKIAIILLHYYYTAWNCNIIKNQADDFLYYYLKSRKIQVYKFHAVWNNFVCEWRIISSMKLILIVQLTMIWKTISLNFGKKGNIRGTLLSQNVLRFKMLQIYK